MASFSASCLVTSIDTARVCCDAIERAHLPPIARGGRRRAVTRRDAPLGRSDARSCRDQYIGS
jgi:hypothetical protein